MNAYQRVRRYLDQTGRGQLTPKQSRRAEPPAGETRTRLPAAAGAGWCRMTTEDRYLLTEPGSDQRERSSMTTKDEVAAYLAAETAARQQHRDEMADILAEEMYDAAHEHCEDGCVGGGRPWYDKPARMLTDPHGVLAEVAQRYVIHLNAQATRRARQAPRETDPLPWRDLLAVPVAEAFGEPDPKALREHVANVAATAIAWLDDLERRGGAA